MPRLAPFLIATIALAAALGGPSPQAAHAGTPALAVPAAVPALPKLAPVPTLPPDGKTIRATIDLALAGHIAKLATFEANYKTGKRNYYQMLISHSTIPADGQSLPPDKLSTRPTDQAGTLSDFFSTAQLPAALPYAFQTDVYDGPQGAGYVLTARVIIAGELWERAVNVGPERDREVAWHVVVAEK